MFKHTAHKHSTILVLKLLVLVCLVVLPIKSAADEAQIQELEQAMIANPSDSSKITALVKAYNDNAVDLANQQQWLHAEDYLNKALILSPTSEFIISNLANVYFEHAYDLFKKPQQHYSNDNHHKAQELTKKSIALDPKNVNAYILLGDINYMNQQMPGAKEAWGQAAALVPDNQAIQSRLDKITREERTEAKMTTKYDVFFNIRVDSSIANVPGFDINRVLNTARAAVSRDFFYSQPGKIPVVVYTYDQYKNTLKDAPEWSDGAYDGKIRIILSATQKDFRKAKSNVIHEYTHAVIGDITNGNCPKWLNEGLAKYEEFKHGVVPDLTELTQAYNSGALIEWKNIDSAFTGSTIAQVLLAYQQSYSFVQYLVQKYSMTKLVSLLKILGTKPDFPAAVSMVYSKPLTTLQSEWQIWLKGFIKVKS